MSSHFRSKQGHLFTLSLHNFPMVILMKGGGSNVCKSNKENTKINVEMHLEYLDQSEKYYLCPIIQIIPSSKNDFKTIMKTNLEFQLGIPEKNNQFNVFQ